MNTAVELPVKQGAVAPSRPAFDVFGSLQRQIDRLFDRQSPGQADRLFRGDRKGSGAAWQCMLPRIEA
jgi:hypothetical protein